MVDTETLRALLCPHTDVEKAFAMAAYMKNHFAFLGIQKPKRHELTREFRKESKSWDAPKLRETVDALWAQDEREFVYLAIDLLRSNPVLEATDLPWLKNLVVTQSWWDSVDALAPDVIGPLVLRFPELGEEIESWGIAPDFWLRRAAIIHQLGFKSRTDEARLFRLCLQNGAEKEFFLRKGIGWALRQYARTNPLAVKLFVAENANSLSPLSRREALKRLGGTVR